MDLARQAIETLRGARFPVYAVAPSQWDGDVMVRGVWGDRKHALSITFSYDDDLTVERPYRQIEVVSTGAEGMSKRPPSHTFLLFHGSYETEIANFVNNIAHTPLPEDRHGVPTPGARRPLPTATFRDELFLEGVAFVDHPELRLYRVQTPQVEILVMGWNWDDESLTEFARKVRPIQGDEALFAEIEAAEFAAWAKIEKRHGPSEP
jgi:hypothetical protein